jgi:hypothetical protein
LILLLTYSNPDSHNTTGLASSIRKHACLHFAM